MLPKKFSLISWPRVAEAFVGLFFAAAAYQKATESFFGEQNAPLRRNLEWWLEQGWPAPGYREFLTAMLPYADTLGVLVILGQAVAGFCLFMNVAKRPAAVILFLVQINVFLGTVMFGIGFITFVGISLWLAAYYFFEDRLTPAKWRWLTLVLILLQVLFLYRRYTMGDPWTVSFAWQHSHYAADVMSASPLMKMLVLQTVSGPYGPMLWAAPWWLLAFSMLLLFTRFRMIGGALWLILITGRAMVWMTSMESEGVLWVLVVFVWLAREEEWNRVRGMLRLIPLRKLLKRFQHSTNP